MCPERRSCLPEGAPATDAEVPEPSCGERLIQGVVR